MLNYIKGTITMQKNSLDIFYSDTFRIMLILKENT